MFIYVFLCAFLCYLDFNLDFYFIIYGIYKVYVSLSQSMLMILFFLLIHFCFFKCCFLFYPSIEFYLNVSFSPFVSGKEHHQKVKRRVTPKEVGRKGISLTKWETEIQGSLSLTYIYLLLRLHTVFKIAIRNFFLYQSEILQSFFSLVSPILVWQTFSLPWKIKICSSHQLLLSISRKKSETSRKRCWLHLTCMFHANYVPAAQLCPGDPCMPAISLRGDRLSGLPETRVLGKQQRRLSRSAFEAGNERIGTVGLWFYFGLVWVDFNTDLSQLSREIFISCLVGFKPAAWLINWK